MKIKCNFCEEVLLTEPYVKMKNRDEQPRKTVTICLTCLQLATQMLTKDQKKTAVE